MIVYYVINTKYWSGSTVLLCSVNPNDNELLTDVNNWEEKYSIAAQC
ncbi:MAG: hypothetical protein IJU54_01385 [Alphaproteobacteria bacterium]|nr:hypothetical protein [Alphaproteobacteria bacterium]